MSREMVLEVTDDMFDPEEDQNVIQKYRGRYVLQRWTWGRKNEAISNATSIDIATMLPKVSAGQLNIETVSACLISAPFPHTPENPNIPMLKGMPSFLGERLLELAHQVNRELNKERKKNLLKQSSTDTPTDQTK